MFMMKQTLMLLLYAYFYNVQCRLEEGEWCGEGCSVVKEVLFTNNLFVRFCELWIFCSLLDPTKSPFCYVIILVLEILVSSKEYVFSLLKGEVISFKCLFMAIDAYALKKWWPNSIFVASRPEKVLSGKKFAAIVF